MPIIEIPVELGSTVYEVVPKCIPAFLECPFNGGYGKSRCGTGQCNAYIRETGFDLKMYDEWNKTIFSTKEKAQIFLDKHNEY